MTCDYCGFAPRYRASKLLRLIGRWVLCQTCASVRAERVLDQGAK